MSPLCDNAATVAKIGRNDPCLCGSGRKFKQCCIAFETPVTDENGGFVIDQPGETPADAGVIFNLHDKTRYVLRKGIIVNQLKRDSLKIAASFDRFCEKDLAEMSALFSLAYLYIGVKFMRSGSIGDEYEHIRAQLLYNAADSCTAAVDLLRSGFKLQSGMLVRNILEMISTALHLSMKPEDLDAFKEGKLDSTKTISEAKKVLPLFGHYYGFFSENFIHVAHLHWRAHPLVEYEGRDEGLITCLMFLKSSIWLLYVATEFVCFDDVVKHRYFEKLGPGKFAYRPSKEERAWLEGFLEESERVSKDSANSSN
jgi:hypothetical protein